MGLGDLLGGKKTTIKADPLAKDINALGKQGIGYMSSAANNLNEKIYNQGDNYVENQIALENNAIRGAAQDAQRRTKQLIAQRGMGMSSIGLGTEVNQAKQLNEKLALNKASGMERLRGLYGDQINMGNQLFGVKSSQGPIQMTNTTYRTGGIAGLIGAGVGAYYGGAGGAQAGMAAGNALGASF